MNLYVVFSEGVLFKDRLSVSVLRKRINIGNVYTTLNKRQLIALQWNTSGQGFLSTFYTSVASS